MSKYILALDQGTSSSRAILFDHDGTPVKRASFEFPQIYPQPGWVSHDPQAIWNSQLNAAHKVLGDGRTSVHDVAAIGITNQRETTVVWDRGSGRAINDAVVWQCRRTADICEGLRARGLESEVRARTGLLIDAYFSGTKVRWLLDNSGQDGQARAQKGQLAFGTVDSWLINKLTAGKKHVIDATNASRTMLYNLRDGAWDSFLLGELNIPAAILPEVVDSSGIVAESEPSVFGRPIPIAGIAGDQQAALFGQGCWDAGSAKNTYGTGCFILQHTGATPVFSQNGLLTTVATRIGGVQAFAVEGSIFIAGAAVQWLRDGLGIIKHASESEALAASVPSSDGVYVVPAFAGLGAPHWDMYARGTITGITRGTTAAHITRATLESIALQTLDVVELMERETGVRMAELRVDGGAVENNLLMQMQADVLQRPVVRAATPETTALGAAYLAGLAVGFWKDRDEIAGIWKNGGTFEPRMSPSERDALVSGWRRAVERAKGWAAEVAG
ncbi:MAG TPA: glycerol kinase GlpK [Dehalococcoidia bacterium]|nr:glycerol kinase GlpK [Dehalococcoidia bacterium]